MSLIALLMAFIVPAAFANNSGTVKVSIDRSQNEPNNEPHVPCQFSLEFFQFQAETVNVDFTAQQPSGDGHILSDTVTLNPSGEDGEEPTFNGTEGYDFTGLLGGLERHEQQGYHIKVTVDEDQEQPPAKHKVFWVDCPEPEPEPAPANLLVDKVVTGEGAPAASTVFTIEVTCDGTTVTAMLTDGDAPWSWNGDSGESDLTDESVCSVDETVTHGADSIVVTFNGSSSGEQTSEDLAEGDNTFVITNNFPSGGVGGDVAADLLVDKVVTGDDAPGADTVFTVEVTCDGTTVTAMLTDGDAPWSWNDDSGESDLTDESVCSVDETVTHGADSIVVTFNGSSSAEEANEDLAEGDNTFVITNNFPSGGVGGAVAADLLVDKVVTGDGAPGADTVFTIDVTCDGTTVTAMLAAGDSWSWNGDSGESDLTDESVCSVDETVTHGADSIVVTFNLGDSGEGVSEDLGEGDNTFVITNDFPAEGAVGGDVAADLLVGKVVTGEGAPDATTVFTVEVTCDGTTVTAMLAAGDAPWSWNDDSGESDLTDESVCSVDETVTHGADSIVVTFNLGDSAEGVSEDLGEGDNTFVITNDFPAEGAVGGVDVEVPVEQPAVDVSPDVVEGAPAGEQPAAAQDVAGEQPAAAQDVADDQVTARELPATGASNTVLLLLALTLVGFGGLAVRQADARVRAN